MVKLQGSIGYTSVQYQGSHFKHLNSSLTSHTVTFKHVIPAIQ